MAQVLKDETRENILKAALQEFYEKGTGQQLCVRLRAGLKYRQG